MAATTAAPTAADAIGADDHAGTDAAAQTFGAGCAAVPTTGAGSFDGMATAPVASAASANPVLSTLVTAVTKAGLVDTLNSQKSLTVFAPTNDAFGQIPPKTLKAVLADKPTLTKILTYHVIAGALSPDQLAGTHKTLEGERPDDLRRRPGLRGRHPEGARSCAATCRPPTPRSTSSTTVLMPPKM